ncbi:MAG: hypothetical protein ACE5RP_00300 [Nitrosopumilus sp.]
MIKKFKKKPVVIEAIQWNGNNNEEVVDFIGWDNLNAEFKENESDVNFSISTLKGDMKVSMGDWVIKGIKGEFYTCKPEIFEETYELVEDE